MKKYLKITIIVIICIFIVLFVIFFSKSIYIKKIEKIYFSSIKNQLNVDVNFDIKSIKKYEDKLNNIMYELYLCKIYGFEIYVEISIIDNILKPNENTIVKVNIQDFKIAKLLYDKYGDKYKITEVTCCGYVYDNPMVSKYNGAYKFELENLQNGNMINGYIPSNGNLNEMFEVNERQDLDFEF